MMKMSRHAKEERCQQRAIPACAFELLAYAETARARKGGEMLFFTRQSYRRMRAAGICPKKIEQLEKKRNLRVVIDHDKVITAMYAYQCNKRIKDYVH